MIGLFYFGGNYIIFYYKLYISAHDNVGILVGSQSHMCREAAPKQESGSLDHQNVGSDPRGKKIEINLN